MEHFLGLTDTEDLNDNEESNDFEVLKQDIDHLYDVIKNYHSSRDIPDEIDPQHRSLLPKLRNYQKAAVKWMVHREKTSNLSPENKNQLHSLYTEVIAKDGTVFYYNRKGGFLIKEIPRVIPLPTGGILADEMGLGKTVEVLSCMLCNPKLDLQKPEPLEIININKESRKRRRRRSPSPTEFQLYDKADETENNFGKEQTAQDEIRANDSISQLDGGESDEDFDDDGSLSSKSDTSEEEYVPKPSTNRLE